MKTRLLRVVMALLLLVAVTGVMARAQSSGEDTKRRVKVRVNPRYPELARSMRIAGKVRIEVLIAADGHVKSANVVGGHPLLTQACVDVIKDWKFEAAPGETTEIVEFEFSPPN
jgi:TonB family protein